MKYNELRQLKPEVVNSCNWNKDHVYIVYTTFGSYMVHTMGRDEQEALDILADYFQDMGYIGMYNTIDKLTIEEAEEGIIAGNEGLYLNDITAIELAR